MSLMNVQITFTPRGDLRKRIHDELLRDASGYDTDASPLAVASLDTISGYVLPQVVSYDGDFPRSIAGTIVDASGKQLVPVIEHGVYTSGRLYSPSQVLSCWRVDGVELLARSTVAMRGMSIRWPLYVWSLPDIEYTIDTELDLRIALVVPHGFAGVLAI